MESNKPSWKKNQMLPVVNEVISNGIDDVHAQLFLPSSEQEIKELYQ